MELLNFISSVLIIPDNFFNKVLTSSIQLLAVVEPFGIIPILINLTKEMEKETSKALSKTAAVTSALLLMVDFVEEIIVHGNSLLLWCFKRLEFGFRNLKKTKQARHYQKKITAGYVFDFAIA